MAANNPNAGPAAALPPWFGRRTVLEAVERLVVNDNINAERGWTRAQIRESLLQAHPQNPGEEELPDAALGTTLTELLRGDFLVTGVNQQHYKLHTAVPHHLPLWFGKDAVLQAVALLDGNNGNHGSTWAQIRDSLMGTHQQEPLLLPPKFHRLLRSILSVLRRRGHLTGGAGGPQHYTCLPAAALDAANNPDHIPMGEFQLGFYLGYMMGGRDGFHNGEMEGMMQGVWLNDDGEE